MTLVLRSRLAQGENRSLSVVPWRPVRLEVVGKICSHKRALKPNSLELPNSCASRLWRAAGRILLLSLGAFLGACASVSVDNIQYLSSNAPSQAPVEILILPFTVEDSVLRVDRTGRDLKLFRSELQSLMNKQLVQRLSKHVAPTRVLSLQEPIPQGNYWLLTGRFASVTQGSRLLRSTVGLGAGGTKMETIIVVQDLSLPTARRFLQFETTGGSNISQGIGGIVTLPMSGPMALTSLFNAVDGLRSGVTFDTGRTAHEITATLSEYLALRGLGHRKSPLKPKRLGQIPNLVPSGLSTGER